MWPQSCPTLVDHQSGHIWSRLWNHSGGETSLPGCWSPTVPSPPGQSTPAFFWECRQRNLESYARYYREHWHPHRRNTETGSPGQTEINNSHIQKKLHIWLFWLTSYVAIEMQSFEGGFYYWMTNNDHSLKMFIQNKAYCGEYMEQLGAVTVSC